jgi:CBS domain-containing protein
MTISAILKEKGGDVVSVTPATSVTEIASIIATRRIGAVVVLAEAKRLAGIVSERDIVKAVANHGDAALRMTADDIMTKKVITATPQTSVNDAMSMMDEGYFRHLPVVEDGTLVGIISVRDVVRAYIQIQALEVDSLTDFVFRGSHTSGLR